METPIVTLDANRAKVEQYAKEWAELQAKPLSVRADARKKEIADSGDADFSRLKQAEGRFIELAIHQDAFLDDAAVVTDLDAGTPAYWKSRYEPVVGVMTASVYGNAPATLYATQDNYATLTPFAFEAEEVKVPKLALTQDVDRLGQREAGLKRQAEALRLSMQQFTINIMLGAALGTSIVNSVENYASPYSGRTVYVVDPNVQSGTYETTNIVNVSSEGGLTPAVLEAIQVQAFLQQRSVRTIHLPVAGLPWRKLLRAATIVANASAFSAGTLPNKDLLAIPQEKWANLFEQNMNAGKSFTMDWFGETWKFKANNLLPQGYAIVTTDQPAVEIFNILEKSVSTDVDDPRDSYFVGHYEKREIAIAQPDPWLRNFMVVNFGNTSNL